MRRPFMETLPATEILAEQMVRIRRYGYHFSSSPFFNLFSRRESVPIPLDRGKDFCLLSEMAPFSFLFFSLFLSFFSSERKREIRGGERDG